MTSITLMSHKDPKLYYHSPSKKKTSKKWDTLMAFMHDCIDCERTNEINKQELIM